MDRIIKQVHLQITRNCNLRCHFCGQWGKKGFFADSSGTEMTLDKWKRVVEELVGIRSKTGTDICVTVWGGEPLVSPHFDEIMTLLKDNKFETEVITNGVLIDRHKEVIETMVDRLYVSIDGPKEIHDEIRGTGVYDKVTSNLRNLNHGNITVMTVITEKLLRYLPLFLEELNKSGIKDLYLQDMIGLNSEEICEYKDWMKSSFGIEAVNIDSWENNHNTDYGGRVDKLLSEADLNKYNYRVTHLSHSCNHDTRCTSPFSHVHIAWNGNVLYCTDFYDFSAGNVRSDTVENIFLNDVSELYRQEISEGKCPSCRHCSWRITKF